MIGLQLIGHYPYSLATSPFLKPSPRPALVISEKIDLAKTEINIVRFLYSNCGELGPSRKHERVGALKMPIVGWISDANTIIWMVD